MTPATTMLGLAAKLSGLFVDFSWGIVENCMEGEFLHELQQDAHRILLVVAAGEAGR